MTLFGRDLFGTGALTAFILWLLPTYSFCNHVKLVKLVNERKIKKRFKENQLKPGKLHSRVMPHQLSLSHLLLLFLFAECHHGGTYSVHTPCLGEQGCAALGHLTSHS